MIARKRNKKRSNAKLQRFLHASNRGWMLDPALSETEEWTECVRAKRRDDEAEVNREAESDELSDEFED